MRGAVGQLLAVGPRRRHVFDRPDGALGEFAGHHRPAPHVGPESLAGAAHQLELDIEYALGPERRPGLRRQGLRGLVRWVDHTGRLPDHVDFAAAKNLAELQADELEAAVAGERDAGLGMVQHGLQLADQRLHLVLLLLALLDHVLKHPRQVTDLALLDGPRRPGRVFAEQRLGA